MYVSQVLLILHGVIGQNRPLNKPATREKQNGEIIMTSSNGNIFRVTGPLWGEVTDHRWISFIKASDAEL